MSRSRAVGFSLVVLLLTLPLGVAAAPVDLTTWTTFDQPHSGLGAPMGGNWVVDLTGASVVQTINGTPTFLVSPDAAEGNRITATFSTPAFDDDFFGMALGFSTAPTDPATDYLLIDWRQADQTIDWGAGTGPVTGSAGLAVSRVTGVPTLNELWGHIDSPANPGGGLTELARGATLGNVGWADNGEYDFVVEYTTESLDVWVDGSLEISLAGVFPAGAWALYDFSQSDMTFSGLTMEPLNDPPEVSDPASPNVTVNEGSVGSNSGAFSDPDGDSLTLSCTGPCTGFVDNLDGTWSWSRTLAEGPDSFGLTITASDGLAETSDSFTVTVLNLPPVITSTSAVPGQHDIDGPLAVWADFTDAGVLDTHTSSWNWGDGTSSAGVMSETDGSGTTSASHLYSDPGFYTVTVTVWDDDGDSDTAVLGQVFVFDPDDFVTGGGWVSSPGGSWVSQPDHTGKATFGFVVRYDKSWDVSGNLQFQLHNGLNLHATSFDYLLINDGVAEFHGAGRVNGVAGYSFEVIATDERLATTTQDLFWIEITGPGGVVYSGALYPPAGLPIVGKGIQVHDR